MTFDELLGELRYMHTGQDGGIVFGTKSDMMALALAEQIEANRKAIEELRAELDKDSTFQPFGSQPWLY